ncbi:hypothetical protein EVJ58_g6881 [Rhodofomes roseus]|uniref:Chromosome segregation in meiosis protein n=1 Tax=Rhodofomes roseus TaxID=34475 RepID=A0A4Y9Y5D1_9APHY|nr:hypothetical protein EVJ58_g6881 [Rhodofomes roseus]
MSSTALDDIWNEPLDEPPHRAPSPIDLTTDDQSPRPPKRPRSSLFLDSGSEDEDPPPPARKSVPPSTEKSEIDAMFDNLDAEPDAFDGDLPPALDLDALRKQEDAKNEKIYKKPSALDLDVPDTSGTAGGEGRSRGSGKEKQPRKPLPKLDEARVLGPDGFPALLKHAKTFRPKGKGHEVYHYWTHKMHPKTPFRETVKRVEKLCHSKRMHVALTVWRDEHKGINRDRKIDPDLDESSDDEEASNLKLGANDPRDSNEVRDDDDVHDGERASSHPPSHPPSSEPPSSDGFADFDLDAMIREEEERQAAEANAGRIGPVGTSAPQSKPAVRDEDEAMWDAFDDDVPHNPGTSTTPYATIPTNPDPDEDEDMWDVIREMEAAESSKASAPSETSGPANAKASSSSQPATNDEGWDEMYA